MRARKAAAQASPTMAVEPGVVFEGRVMGVGQSTVEAHVEPDGVVEARRPAHVDVGWLRAAVEAGPVEGAFVVPRGGGRAVLLAVFPGPEHAQVRADITLVGRHVRIEAEAFRVQGKGAHVSVEENGSVELRGRDVTSRATRVNRIRGGAIRLS